MDPKEEEPSIKTKGKVKKSPKEEHEHKRSLFFPSLPFVLIPNEANKKKTKKKEKNYNPSNKIHTH